MLFKKANLEDFHRIKQFYWDLIDEMSDQNDKIGWKKGIYRKALTAENILYWKKGVGFVQA